MSNIYIKSCYTCPDCGQFVWLDKNHNCPMSGVTTKGQHKDILEQYDHCWYCGGPTKKEWNKLKDELKRAYNNADGLKDKLGWVESVNNIYEDDLELLSKERDRLKAELAEEKERLKRVWGYYGRDTVYYCTQRDEARRWAGKLYKRVQELEKQLDQIVIVSWKDVFGKLKEEE